MPFDPTALRTEIATDPRGYGYAAKVAAADDRGLAGLLNLARAAIPIKRADITPAEVFGAINVADYTALPANPSAAQLSSERRYLAWLSGLAAVPAVRLQNDDGTDGPVIANLKAMFAAGTGTLTRLQALQTRSGSRAEELFGATVAVTPEQCGAAR
jgi:hypothetical protein